MITKYKLDVPFIVSKFKEHNHVKDTILDLISKQPSVEETGKIAGYQNNDRIFKTDWYVNSVDPREYWKFLFPYLDNHMAPVFANLYLKSCIYTNYWFQQYETLDTHGWHRHDRTFYSNVYYLELPKDGPRTIFKNPFNGEEIIHPDVEEGDILTFPSIVEHCSMPNVSSGRKTIISFNIA
jgi:hypothetical protein